MRVCWNCLQASAWANLGDQPELCCNAMSAVGKRSFSNAVAQVRAGIPEGLLSRTAVSGDASYMTRGRKSTQSITTLVACKTGKVIDVRGTMHCRTIVSSVQNLLFRCYQLTSTQGKKLPQTPDPNYAATFQGKSTEMERAGLRAMLARSVPHYALM